MSSATSSGFRSGLVLIAMALSQREEPRDGRPDEQEPACDQRCRAIVQQDFLVAEECILITLSPVKVRQILHQANDEHDSGNDRENDGDASHASSPSDGRGLTAAPGGGVSDAAAPTAPASGSANGSTAPAALACRAPMEGTTARATRSARPALIAASTPLPIAFDQVSTHIWYQV